MSLQKQTDWKSIEKIKRLYKTTKNQTRAIYNHAKKQGISYEDAYKEVMNKLGLTK